MEPQLEELEATATEDALAHPNPAGERRGHAGLGPLRLLTVRGTSPAHQ